MKKGLIIALALLVAAGAAYKLMFSGNPAPEVKLTSLTGAATSTSALKGKVVLVNFWATSCPGCVEEMPEIKKLHQDYGGKGLNVLAVAMSYDPPNYVQNFVAKNQLPFFVALDPQGTTAKAFGDIQLAPTTFLIDKQGNIIKRYVGVMNFPEVRKLIEQHL
ncbi:TlpA family protein disulfide reductase [Chromobacterium vaccinii]|uniref:TlpA family protein disulfide reductase n=1 Tax=Chromobacterium TaxID=535 RepID=UPI001C8BA21E|nr:MULTISPECIES: TlpA disulfide reductase family protein [Chromobacterium]MBX9297032.1 TlpA family protein disulfide reductase [Chromobacterium vaccinii]MBX9359337.1 TlpA family protein disulfide reductase [Chromobacterium vaccinii]MCD4484493.1 TlpA family protein disulfide reductase [Chromobacterium vaccinii]MCD4500346.1 TlpA family protein disulfide reductase [Chromobacterium vaccinii]MCD5328122.1 TlpA family protein disulfide reductase [Chromobacterium piscinae]